MKRAYAATRLWTLAALTVVVLLVCSCASNPVYYRADSTEFDGSGTLAVLPPMNLTNNQSASDVVMDALVVKLLDTRTFEVVDPGIVETIVTDKRLRLTDRLPLATLREIGAQLQVEYLLVGSVSEFGAVHEGKTGVPCVSVSLRLVRCTDGRIVWAASQSRRGDDTESVFGLGRVTTTERLVGEMVRDMVDTMTHAKN